MIWSTALEVLLIFGLRVVDVSMGTIRTLLTVRGLKLASALIGFFEVLVFVVAFTRVMREIDNLWNLLAYCGGFAAGTLAGMALDERMALGFDIVRIISRTQWAEITQALRDAGFGATQVMGEGKNGPVGIVYTIVRRKQLQAVLGLCNELAPGAFITSEGARHVYRGYVARALK